MNFKTPIAEQMRPQTLADMVGQSELLGPGKALRNIIKQHVNIMLIFLYFSGSLLVPERQA